VLVAPARHLGVRTAPLTALPHCGQSR
jgi:hypothetical protein